MTTNRNLGYRLALRTGGVVVIAMALASCASATKSSATADVVAVHASGATGVTLPPPTFAGPIKTPVVYPVSGITLAVPRSTLTTITASDAYGTCGSGGAICDPTMSPTISLADATVAQAGTQDASGTLTPLLSSRLVYVLYWQDSRCVRAGGPPPAPNASPSPATPQSCYLVDLVDAQTGSVLYATRGPSL